MRKTARVTKWLLYVQLVLAGAASVLANLALMTIYSIPSAAPFHGVATSLIAGAVALIVLAAFGVVALRLRRMYLRSAVALLTPLVLLAATLVLGETETSFALLVTDPAAVHRMLALQNWAGSLALGAVLTATSSAVLLLVLRRNRGAS